MSATREYVRGIIAVQFCHRTEPVSPFPRPSLHRTEQPRLQKSSTAEVLHHHSHHEVVRGVSFNPGVERGAGSHSRWVMRTKRNTQCYYCLICSTTFKNQTRGPCFQAMTRAGRNVFTISSSWYAVRHLVCGVRRKTPSLPCIAET